MSNRHYYDDHELERAVYLIQLGLPVETLAEMGCVYNAKDFKKRSAATLQYYYAMLLRRRDYLTEDVDGFVLSTKRLVQYIRRMLVYDAFNEGMSHSELMTTFHVSRSFISMVSSNVTHEGRVIPNRPDRLERTIRFNIALADAVDQGRDVATLFKDDAFNPDHHFKDIRDMTLVANTYIQIIHKYIKLQD